MTDFFPIMLLEQERRIGRAIGLCTAIPWEMIAPHEEQAQRNHHQSLKRLAERGGLAPSEAVAVLEDRRWVNMHPAEARARLEKLVNEWRKNANA